MKVEAAALEEDLRKVPTPERTQNLVEGLKTLAQKYPLLQDLELDAAAAERVLAKAPHIGHMKGQLLERTSGKAGCARCWPAKRARRSSRVKSYKQASWNLSRATALTDVGKAQLTDGLLVVRDGDKMRVVAVFESKAGKASAKGRRRSDTSLSELSEADLKELRSNAIEELMERRPELAKMRSAEIARKYPEEIDAIMKEFPLSEFGDTLGKTLSV